jgi:hypothetical protein
MLSRSLRPLGILAVLISLSALSARADISPCQANGLFIGFVANKPFTAEVRIASWQLSNGDREDMHIMKIMKVARDRNGRVMVLFPQQWSSEEARETGGQPTKWQTMICDPKGLDTTVTAKQIADANLADVSNGGGSVEARIAVQSVSPRSTVSDRHSFDGPHMSPENFTVADLGVGAVGDISAHRFRYWKKAAGETSNGNYAEQAFSEDLELVVAKIQVEGNSIAHGTEYIHLDRGDPDPALFLIPATYKIISQTELPPAN